MKDLTQSLEKYLFAISEVVEKNSAARVKDIATKLSIGMASTSEAVKSLTKKGYINYEPYGLITMTASGKAVVREKIERHRIICEFLEKVLLLEKSEIETYANSIEFFIPEKVLSRFVAYITFMQKCSCKEPKWLKSYQSYIKTGEMPEKCKSCSSETGCRGCTK